MLAFVATAVVVIFIVEQQDFIVTTAVHFIVHRSIDCSVKELKLLQHLQGCHHFRSF